MGDIIYGYLLDTNVISAWFNSKKEGHSNLLSHLNKLPGDAPLFISVITLGEIEYGHWVESPQGPTDRQIKQNEFVDSHFPSAPYRIQISHHTVSGYGRIRAMIFEKYSPKNGRKVKRLHQLDIPDNIEEYGHKIQENDLWLAAQALEHNLILVTNDKMKVIRECAKLCNFNHPLQIEDWLKL